MDLPTLLAAQSVCSKFFVAISSQSNLWQNLFLSESQDLKKISDSYMPAYTGDVAWKWRFFFFKWKGNLKIIYALYDFTAQDDDELTFATNDVMYVVNEDPSGWWTVQTFDGKFGVVPSNYFEEMFP